MTEAGQFAMWLAIGGTTVSSIMLLQPVVKAWARRIEAGSAAPELRERLEALEHRAMEETDGDAMRQRVAELEERIDFAERLLGQARNAERALPGADG